MKEVIILEKDLSIEQKNHFIIIEKGEIKK
jgi:hypothetical protein